MSLILDTLRRRARPLAAPPGPLHHAADAPAEPARSYARGVSWTIGHLVICVLFLIILGVSGWVLIEWLLGRAPSAQRMSSSPQATHAAARVSAARPQAPAPGAIRPGRGGSSSHYNLALP